MNRLSDSYFHEMYATEDDPWGFGDRWYEQRKYQLTLAALSAPTYGRAFEAGCSIGVLSEQLAPRCDHLLCVDVADRATTLAAQRLARFGDRVEVQTRDFVDGWPPGEFDLIVLSEVLYYLEPATLDRLVDRLTTALTDVGELIVVHWRWPVAEYPQTGDAVHDRLTASALHQSASYRDADLRLDVFHRSDRPSVAQSEGLVSAEVIR
ncbi:SAM-dependent methyltransferase [Gordonia sp. CPCC 205515]|uniref:class I SAM-dependent DNA methyltransferase n=1 Tax=Gordonia sp. CPCC 205515 TaxID=3140791 RepID=UPI003AF39853